MIGYTDDALDLCDVLGSYVPGGRVKPDEASKIVKQSRVLLDAGRFPRWRVHPRSNKRPGRLRYEAWDCAGCWALANCLETWACFSTSRVRSCG